MATSKVSVLFVTALLGVACGSSSSDATPAEGTSAKNAASPSNPPIVMRFDCDTLALTATFRDDGVTIEVPQQRALTLPHVASASGARYSNGTETFWNKGREATFEWHGHTETCRERREPWQEAFDRGVDFRAVGQEPGWFLEIDEGQQIRLVYDYAEHELDAPAPAPSVNGPSTTYDTTAKSEHRRVPIRIVVEESPCTDSMSGETFPRSVVVTVGDRTLHGCGRELGVQK